MQLKLNQEEIQQAITEFLQKRYKVNIAIIAFDLKGIRSEEGYHANVEIEFEDVAYEHKVPKVISFETKISPEPEPEIPEIKLSDNRLTAEDVFCEVDKNGNVMVDNKMKQTLLEVLHLLNTNANGVNDIKILKLCEDSPLLDKYLSQYPEYTRISSEYRQDSLTDNIEIETEVKPEMNKVIFP